MEKPRPAWELEVEARAVNVTDTAGVAAAGRGSIGVIAV